MNQNDQMREALTLALEYWRHRQQRYNNRRPVWVDAAEQALAAELAISKTETTTEPAKLVRLTDMELLEAYMTGRAREEKDPKISHHVHGMRAIMDAMERLNGGQK